MKISALPFPAKRAYLEFSLFLLDFRCFIVKFPSESSAVATTPSNPLQPQLDQHALIMQVSILNKQLALLRGNQVANIQAVQKIPLENVTKVLNTASSLLPQALVTTSSSKGNSPKATTPGGRRGPKPLLRDPVTGKIIRPRDSERNLTIHATFKYQYFPLFIRIPRNFFQVDINQ